MDSLGTLGGFQGFPRFQHITPGGAPRKDSAVGVVGPGERNAEMTSFRMRGGFMKGLFYFGCWRLGSKVNGSMGYFTYLEIGYSLGVKSPTDPKHLLSSDILVLLIARKSQLFAPVNKK